MKEKLYNAAWGVGVRLAHLGKRLGVSGPFERVAEKTALRFIPLPKGEVEVVIPGGMKLVVPPGFPRARTYAVGAYEREVTHLFHEVVTEGMGVVDIGAFCGYYTLTASQLVGASGRVYAFEPDPRNYKYVVRNVEANGCRNVLAADKAVSNSTGAGALASHREADHRFLAPSSPGGDAIPVPTVTLDAFFAAEGWPRIDLIKMDIEGGEVGALQGMMEVSRRNPHLQVIMEYDLGNLHRAGASREAVAAVLQQLGFSKGYVIEQKMKPFSVAQDLPRSKACYDLLLKKQ